MEYSLNESIVDKYDVDVEYDTHRPGDSFLQEMNDGFCNCDICRCSTIENAHVEEIDASDFSSIFENIKRNLKFYNKSTRRWKQLLAKKPTLSSEVIEYCIKRLMIHHEIFNTSLYEIDVGGGYYGEEIDGVIFEHEDGLKSDILKMVRFKTNIEKIKFVLEKEYKFLLNRIKDCNEVYLEILDIEKLCRNSVEMDRIKNQSEDYPYSIDETTILGIVHEGVIIDGHNRTRQALVNNMEYGYYIVVSNSHLNAIKSF